MIKRDFIQSCPFESSKSSESRKIDLPATMLILNHRCLRKTVFVAIFKMQVLSSFYRDRVAGMESRDPRDHRDHEVNEVPQANKGARGLSDNR